MKSNQIKYSFIVPVYNVEKYINQCINSILQQSYKNYEIILVDDGSEDRSGVICDEYSSKYNFIKTIHQKNEGLSGARNTGIKNACGEYLLFVDSDDYIAENALIEINDYVKKTNNETTDIIFLKAYKVFENNKIVYIGDNLDDENISHIDKNKVIKYISTLPKFPGSACTKMIKREVVIKNKLFFKEKLISEDIDWTLDTLLVCNTYAYCDANYYYYRQNREGSITSTKTSKTIDSLLYIINKYIDYKEYKEEICAILSYLLTILIYKISFFDNGKRKKYEKEIKEILWLTEYANNTTTKIVRLFINIFGLHFTIFAIKYLYRIKKRFNF